MFTQFATKTLFAFAAVSAAALTLSPATAAIAAPRSVAVPFTDLDLKTDAGQTQLRKRVAFAAEVVCGPADTMNYHSKKAVAACQDRAIQGASRAMVEVFAQAGGEIRVAAN